jgi:quinol monooxygenase YgiN
VDASRRVKTLKRYIGDQRRISRGSIFTCSWRSRAVCPAHDYRLDAFIREVQVLKMDSLSNFVSLHPYFKVHPGKIEAFKAALPAFMEKTATEEKNLFYGFSINGDEIFCREGYLDAEGVIAHLDNVGALLAEALKISDLIRLELHGPAQELDKLTGPLAHLNPAWFTLECSVRR